MAKHTFPLFLVLSLFISCTKGPVQDNTEPEPEDIYGNTEPRTITARFAETKAALDTDGNIRWSEGDYVILSNCVDVLLFSDGAMMESVNADCFKIDGSMISEDGSTLTFTTCIPTAPKYSMVVTSSLAPLRFIGSSGMLQYEDPLVPASVGIPYLASGISETNDFVLDGVVNLLGVKVSYARAGMIEAKIAGNRYQHKLNTVPAWVYFPITKGADCSRGAEFTVSTAGGDKIFTHKEQAISFDNGIVLNLGDICVKEGYGSTFDLWQGGMLSCKVGSYTIDSKDWGEGHLITGNQNVSSPSGAYFLDDGAVLSISGDINGSFAVLDNGEDGKVNIKVNGPIDVCGGKDDGIFIENADFSASGDAFNISGEYGTLYFSNSRWRVDGGQNILFKNANSRVDNLEIRSNTFFAESPCALQLFEGAGTTVAKATVQDNFIVNLLPANGAFIDCGKPESITLTDNYIIYYGNMASSAVLASATDWSGNVSASGNVFYADEMGGNSFAATENTAADIFELDPLTVKSFAEGLFTIDLKDRISRSIIQDILTDNNVISGQYCLENESVKAFVHNFEYDSDYSYTKISDYIGSDSDAYPAPAYVSLEDASEANMVIIVSEDGKHKTINIDSETPILEVYNLIPGRTYRYGIISNSYLGTTILKKGAFKTEGSVRMIKTNYIRNVRDCGGWKGLDGKTIKYGLLSRGGQIKDKSYSLSKIEQDDFDALVKDLGVGYDIDLRADNEVGGIDWSPAHVPYLHLALWPYDGISHSSSQELYKKGIKQLIENARNGICTYVHCQAGADRTGTYIFLVEGALGVSESDLCKDYELTSFYDTRFRNDGTRYLKLISAINRYSQNGDINEAICNYLEAIGITKGEIEELRSLLLE